jgi:hypothetical protein
MLAVRGQEGLFRHQDRNTLVRVEAPAPNPLARKRDVIAPA